MRLAMLSVLPVIACAGIVLFVAFSAANIIEGLLLERREAIMPQTNERPVCWCYDMVVINGEVRVSLLPFLVPTRGELDAIRDGDGQPVNQVFGKTVIDGDTLFMLCPMRFPTPEELQQLRAASKESATRAATELDDWMQDKRGDR